MLVDQSGPPIWRPVINQNIWSSLCDERAYMCMNTSPNVLEWLKPLRFMGIDIFFKQFALDHGITQGDNSEIQPAVFSKR